MRTPLVALALVGGCGARVAARAQISDLFDGATVADGVVLPDGAPHGDGASSDTPSSLGPRDASGSDARPADPTRGEAPPSELALGYSHTCAVMRDASVRCWGRILNSDSLGTTRQLVPTPVTGLAGVVGVALGWVHTCVLMADATVRCWGHNDIGELGDGATSSRPGRLTPAAVLGVRDVAQVVATRATTCARAVEGTVRCWGANYEGLVAGQRMSWTGVPIVAPGVTGAVDLALGGNACARRADGAFLCWGQNPCQQLGDLGLRYPLAEIPTLAPALAGVVQVAFGPSHVCLRANDGTVRCAGNNFTGALGDDAEPFTCRALAAARAVALTGVAEIAAGGGHTCARMIDGTARCWGNNHRGQLGDGSTLNRASPAPVLGLNGVVRIIAGYDHTCARLHDGTVRCWGWNGEGQLGDGTTTDRLIPTPVLGLTLRPQ